MRPGTGFAASSLLRARRRLDLIVDLGDRIGSRDWFRGAATCLALCYAAGAFAPGFGPVLGASPAALSAAQAHEAEALSIRPLALGASTGRRVAPTDAVVPVASVPERPTLKLLATVGEADGFTSALQRGGVARAEAKLIEGMVASVADTSAVRPGTIIDLTLGKRPSPGLPRPVEALSFRARFDLKLELKRVGGRLTLSSLPLFVDERPLRLQGVIGPSLYQTLRAAGLPARAVADYIRALASRIDIGAVEQGDRYDLIVEHRRAGSGEAETGALLYAGLDQAAGARLQLMSWVQGGRPNWFEASGVGRENGQLQRPVPGSVSSDFGARRHPILGYTRMHRGIDFRAGYGTPILAATDGVVTRAGWAGGYGQQVRLAHAGGLSTSYSHMSRIVAEPGERVRQGQLIGYVGSTGLSTGPHLHYELHLNGTPIDPASVRFTSRARLSGPELAAFRSRLNALLSLRPVPSLGSEGP
jgi:murein DD-endopeptidase MepM/ murein hydrolase activator NlpD